jgi:hypothetical protein
MTGKYRDALIKNKEVDNHLKNARDVERKLEARVQAMTAELGTLQKQKSKYQKWEERLPQIKHYLNIVPSLARYAHAALSVACPRLITTARINGCASSYSNSV